MEEGKEGERGRKKAEGGREEKWSGLCMNNVLVLQFPQRVAGKDVVDQLTDTSKYTGTHT